MTTTTHATQLTLWNLAIPDTVAVSPRTPAPPTTSEHKLREALAAYRLDGPTLRHLAVTGADIRQAVATDGETLPPDLLALLDTWTALMRHAPGEPITRPSDLAAFLMVEMGHLDQEELRVACLDTKNRLQHITTVYRGTVDRAPVRVGEIFKEAVRRNSTSIILTHNHPSGNPQPSPEDVLLTQQVVDAGRLFDIAVLDHLVIGRGQFVSLREQRLGFAA